MGKYKLKPIIVIDTREKKPYIFQSGLTGSVFKKLPAGDYSLEGYENKISIERKTITDLISTVVHDKPRFKKELLKLMEYDYAYIVVEYPIYDVLAGKYISKIRPKVLLNIVAAIMINYKIPVLFADNRVCAASLTETLLLQYYKRVKG